MLLLLISIQLLAIQAQDYRIALRGSSRPCEGRLEVYYKNKWGLVGHHQWTDANGEVVCRSLGCDKHVKSGNLYPNYKNLSPLSQHFWLDEIKCTGHETNLWNCPSNGWNVTHCQIHVSVNCSGNISPVLNLYGVTGECAGVLQFTTPGGVMDVCKINIDNETKVCQELNCGTHVKTHILKTSSSKGVDVNCMDNEDFLWQCVNWTGPRPNPCQNKIHIVCSDHKRIHLDGGADVCQGTLESKKSAEANWNKESCEGLNNSVLDNMCAKMKCGRAAGVNPCNNDTWLNCTDRVKVELIYESKPSVCYGDINVNVNGAHQEVCVAAVASLEKVAEVVCKELKCGTSLSVSLNTEMRNKQISHVECDGQEKSLWECIHKLDANGTCKTINVTCSGSLDMRLSYGLDKCAGQLEIKSQNSWWSMNTAVWNANYSNMVCHHLDCGDSVENKERKFVKSKFPVLDWKLVCKNLNISQCQMEYQSSKGIGPVSTVNIICNKYKLWFLQGDSPCEGRVKTESGEYLQNVTDEQAAEVCKRNYCVQPDKTAIRLTNSSDCPANSTFNCSEPQYAHVNCSVSRDVRLEKTCYGKVLVSSDNKKYGVCEDTWTEDQSRMLCKILGCGDVINERYRGKTTGGVTIASVHCSESAQNFSQCNFIQLEDPSLCKNAAHIACTGSVRAEMKDSRDKCAGNPKLFYAGAFVSLCTSQFTEQSQNALCSNLGCGNAVSFEDAISSTSNNEGVSGVACSAGKMSNCNFSESEVKQCKVGFINCTGWRRLLLTRSEEDCTGEVYLQNMEHLYAVSSDGWNQHERNQLCKYLNCGNFISSVQQSEVQQIMPFWNKSYNCAGKSNSIWDCENDKKPSGNQHLHISCTDKPNVTLQFNCSGEVRINSSNMCYKSRRTEQVFHEFCQQLGCSMFFRAWSTKSQGSARYVSCTGGENKLWKCNSWMDPCESVVSLACSQAITWRFSEVCGGELQVNYRRRWEPVCPLDNKDSADRICQESECGNERRTSVMNVEKDVIVDVKIECKNTNKHLMHCFKPASQTCTEKAVIYCENYTPPGPPPDIGLIVGIVVGLILLLVATIIVFKKRKTLLAVLRSKSSPADDSDEEFSENEMQSLHEKDGAFETDDYDDIDITENPMKENNRQITDSDHDEEDGSTSPGSSGTEYDDVDEESVQPPAKSVPSDPVVPPRPQKSLDTVTFEAEVEPQEDYDDVILPQDEIREQGETGDVADPSSNPPFLLSDIEAQPQDDE